MQVHNLHKTDLTFARKLKFEVSVEEIQNLVKWFTQPKHRPDKHIYYPTQV